MKIKSEKLDGEPKKDSILQDIKTIQSAPSRSSRKKNTGSLGSLILIKGKDNKSWIATLIERNTRLCILATLPDAKAESVARL